MKPPQDDLRLPALTSQSRDVSLSVGTIRVREIGHGPTVVFVHGLFMDGRVWDPVVALLQTRFRCVIPDLPLGAHRMPWKSDADRTPEGVARALDELSSKMELTDVTVVATDSGGAVTQFWMAQGAPRVRRVVLTPCDCFDNFLPPSFAYYQRVARVPGALRLLLNLARIPFVRGGRGGYGGFTHRAIDDTVLQSWLNPILSDARVAGDAEAFLRGISSERLTVAERTLSAFRRPVLLVWAPEQSVFPLSDATELARTLPQAQLLEVRDSGALISLEQPAALAAAIRAFISGDWGHTDGG